jgi:hypothetical protein
VASESSIRLWRVHREAGRPWPVVCAEDDVIDYMVMEAVAIRVRRRDEQDQKEAEKKAAIDDFKKKTMSALGQYQ